MSTRPPEDPLSRLQRFIGAASSPARRGVAAPAPSGEDALGRLQALIERARRERAWPPPLSGILTSLYHALDLDSPLEDDTPGEGALSLIEQLTPAAVRPTSSAPARPAASAAPVSVGSAPSTPADAQDLSPPDAPPARASADLDRTAELLLAAIATRPLDGPSRAIVARLLTEAISEQDWASARRALEIVVTGG